jgi:hypothetical protein
MLLKEEKLWYRVSPISERSLLEESVKLRSSSWIFFNPISSFSESPSDLI